MLEKVHITSPATSSAATSPVKFRTTATGYRRIRLFRFRSIMVSLLLFQLHRIANM